MCSIKYPFKGSLNSDDSHEISDSELQTDEMAIDVSVSTTQISFPSESTATFSLMVHPPSHTDISPIVINNVRFNT